MGGSAWQRGGPYERYIGRWSRLVAREFLQWLGLPAGQRWIDVGCGTGALVAAVLAGSAPRAVLAMDQSEGFLGEARRTITDRRVLFALADATALPWREAWGEVAISGLVLNFVPDPQAMVAEMARVTRAGGMVAAYVWDYRGGMPMLRHFWDAAIALSRDAATLDQAERFPLCQPGPLEALWRGAGLHHVATHAVEIPMRFRDFDDYWLPFLGGQGPAPAYLATLGREEQETLRTLLSSRLPSEPDGSISLSARAWTVRGRV